MSTVEIAKGIYWVGVIDWKLRDFHGLTTRHGSTYNAYLVIDDKITLIDTVDPRFYSEMIDRIKEIIDPADIDYIVSNHAEPDHAGSIAELKRMAKGAKVLATGMGVKRLREYNREELDFQEVKDQETISLGNRSLKFIHAPMLHWPETMFTYVIGDGILFSCDAFGSHIASFERFVDEIGKDQVIYQAKLYYGMLVSPFSKNVLSAFGKVSGLNISIVAPSHGPIWRKDLEFLFEAYRKWASHELEEKVVLVYATMWGSTERMASYIYEGITGESVSAVVHNLDIVDWSDIIGDILTSRVVLLGSPTYVGGIYPRVEGFLSFLRILNESKKLAAFGSYGWSGGAVRKLHEWAETNRFEVINAGLEIQFVPDDEGKARCIDYGRQIGRLVKS